MTLLLAIVLSFGPALAAAAFVYWLDRYEKEPKRLIGLVFGWGALVAVLGALGAQLVLDGAMLALTDSEDTSDLVGATLFAPLTEESLKGLAVLAIFLLLRREFDSLLDGLVYSGVVALGFAATENVLYLYGEALEQGLPAMMTLFVLRIVLGIWNHPLYTAFIGIGLAISRFHRSAWARWTAPVLGWTGACLVHSLHNGLATAAAASQPYVVGMLAFDWAGWLFMAVLILVAIRQEGRLLASELGDEVQGGFLSPGQYHAATSSWRRTGACLRALPAGRWRATRRFYQLCGELAHKKNQLNQMGDENGNVAHVQQLRTEMSTLSRQAMA
jgi:protease PrsW